MNRIENAFKNKPIFMPYFPLGYPDLETSIDVIEALAKNGADLIEVGLVLLRSAGGWTGHSKGNAGCAREWNHGKKITCGCCGVAQARRDHPADPDGIFQPHAGVRTGEICPRCARSRCGWIYHP